MRWIYGKQDWNTLKRGIENNYLLTNGLGGFSSLTITGAASRNDHSLLMACVKPPNHRYNIIHRLSERLYIEQEGVHLSTQEFSDGSREEGYRYLSAFVYEDVPLWKFHINGVAVYKEIGMKQEENTIALCYIVENHRKEEVVLEITPFFQFAKKGEDMEDSQSVVKDGNTIISNGMTLYFETNGIVSDIEERTEVYYYSYDACDGRRETGHAKAGHVVSITAKPGEKVKLNLVYSMESMAQDAEEIIESCEKRRKELVKKSGLHMPMAQELVKSANQFISKRESTNGSTILAGYPFFEDWGRDTMLALPGVCITTGQYETAKEILRTFALNEKNGLMPNLFPEGGNEPLYNTVDAALLFINCVYLYYEAVHDLDFVKEMYPVMEHIIKGYKDGTDFGIRMDEDGLIQAGEGLWQVTWMDVRVGEVLPTPRHGKPVEINAYWYNALCIMEKFAQLLMKEEKEKGLKELVKSSFLGKFWMEEEGCLKDLVSGTKADKQIRCNQIWAVSMPFTMLNKEQERGVVETVFEKLYTPYGLRTLEKEDAEFHPCYQGKMEERDMAYHQGTVWPFPLGAYYLAYLKVHGYSKESKEYVRDQLEVMESAMREGCIGQLPEIYDGENPTRSKGCFAQAWSVGEILRVYEAIEKKSEDKEKNMEKLLEKILKEKYGKNIREASNEQIYTALLILTKEKMQGIKRNEGKKKLYYISAEFLIGKLLSNNLINLGLFDETKEILKKNGHDITEIEELELEPSLGNGGLGRLAACFLDSIATLGLNGDGIGLNYHDGLFLQTFKDNKQREEKNPWITDLSWLTKTGVSFSVPFKDFTLQSVMYDIDVPGYKKGCNRLHLFDIETVDEGIIRDGIGFDKKDIAKNLTLFLYPDDSDEAGRLLRIYQQYFMVSNAAQLILKEAEERGCDLYHLYDYVTVQINDTHPTMVIPELIRLLMERGFNMDTAVDVVRKTCAYTNHTILAEALEKWPLSYLEQVVPHLVPIIRNLDARVRRDYHDERVYIIDNMDRVHMAHIDIHFGYAVNGVAALHTEILKESELKPFYDIYPEKFNNKTNGITFRRWLLHCNQELSTYLEELIGPGFKDNADELEKLLAYKDDETVLNRLTEIKYHAKEHLKDYLKNTQNVDIDANSVFDIQIKRLHEYKRQQMNALYAIYKYKEIKKGNFPKRPVTMIFGAKAAPAYTIAKDIIHLLLCLQQLIDSDPVVSKHMKLVMVENYNVTKAEKLIPACDISEQISLASKEASGTGNMKFMLNGAVTLGTEDGANVEIHQLVGDDNIYIFGKKSEDIIKLYEEGTYCAKEIYENDFMIQELVDFIISKELILIGDPVNLGRLYKEIVSKDWFMALLDVKEYIQKKEEVLNDYEDETAWAKKALVNIAKAGYFSADRTIAEYNRDIWKLS